MVSLLIHHITIHKQRGGKKQSVHCPVMGSRGGTGAGGDHCRRRADTAPCTSPERSCNLSMVPSMSGPQGWADLPDGLLHSIVSLLGNFPNNLLAFAATCPSWRAAFFSYPPNYFVPLLLQPAVPLCSPRPPLFGNSLIPKRPCYITDLANQDTYMCCQIPLLENSVFRVDRRTPLDSFYLRGAYYGNLILSNKQSCVVVDVFTGATVSPPQLPVDAYTLPQYGIAALTAPLTSPNSHLMLTTESHHFFWRVGSHSWLRHPSHNRDIKQTVLFKGQVFGIDDDHKLFITHLVPQVRIEEIRVDWEGVRTRLGRERWLVACGDMLVMVGCTSSFPSACDAVEAFRLDLSTEPAKWVKVEKLENYAIFISIEEKSQPLCCINPERWGGRSNCIYCCYDGYVGCLRFELGAPPQQEDSWDNTIYTLGPMQPMWVVPSMFC